MSMGEDGGDGKAAWEVTYADQHEWLTQEQTGRAPGHLTSIKNEFGDCTILLSLCLLFSNSGEGLSKSTARVWIVTRHGHLAAETV